MISLISYAWELLEYQKTIERESATELAIINVAALFLMSILIDLYFIHLIQ